MHASIESLHYIAFNRRIFRVCKNITKLLTHRVNARKGVCVVPSYMHSGLDCRRPSVRTAATSTTTSTTTSSASQHYFFSFLFYFSRNIPNGEHGCERVECVVCAPNWVVRRASSCSLVCVCAKRSVRQTGRERCERLRKTFECVVQCLPACTSTHTHHDAIETCFAVRWRIVYGAPIVCAQASPIDVRRKEHDSWCH